MGRENNQTLSPEHTRGKDWKNPKNARKQYRAIAL